MKKGISATGKVLIGITGAVISVGALNCYPEGGSNPERTQEITQIAPAPVTATAPATAPTEPSLFDRANLPEIYNFLGTTSKIPEAIVIRPNPKSLEHVISFLSSDSKTRPYTRYVLHGKEAMKLSELVVPQDANYEIRRGEVGVVASRDFLYDAQSATRISKKRESFTWINKTPWDKKDSSKIIFSCQGENSPQSSPCVYPIGVNEKQNILVLYDADKDRYLVVNPREAVKNAQQGKVLTPEDKSVIKIGVSHFKSQEEIVPYIRQLAFHGANSVGDLVGGFLKKDYNEARVNNALRRRGTRTRLIDIYDNYGVFLDSNDSRNNQWHFFGADFRERGSFDRYIERINKSSGEKK